MSYTDYLKRMKINTPQVIDTQMRLPDASSFTWRTKMAATHVNRRTDHVINNSQDLGIAPRLFSPSVMGYPGSGFGGKVQDASSYTLSLGSTAIGQDNFTRGKLLTKSTVGCLTYPPASQVVSEFGNIQGELTGLNMGYSRQITRNGDIIQQTGLCTAEFRPQAKSYFVDTIPDVKFHKSGTAPQPVSTQTPGGRQTVQNPIDCATTNTPINPFPYNTVSADQPYNSYSRSPNNCIGSGANIVHGAFVTGIQGPQVGGGTLNGSRAPKVGGPTPFVKHTITHRGWASPSRMPYPYPRVPPRGAPAQLKINDPNHYKT
jgi:hypothetical protein